jgi:hypothetical protein
LLSFLEFVITLVSYSSLQTMFFFFTATHILSIDVDYLLPPFGHTRSRPTG